MWGDVSPSGQYCVGCVGMCVWGDVSPSGQYCVGCVGMCVWGDVSPSGQYCVGCMGMCVWGNVLLSETTKYSESRWSMYIPPSLFCVAGFGSGVPCPGKPGKEFPPRLLYVLIIIIIILFVIQGSGPCKSSCPVDELQRRKCVVTTLHDYCRVDKIYPLILNHCRT